MRIIPLLRCYELLLFADEADGVVGDLRHVARLSGGGAVYTPVGHFSAIHDPAEPEQPARWRVEAFLRTDIIHDPATNRTVVAMDAKARAIHYDPDLPRAIADALLSESVCTEPLLLKIWEGRMTDYVARGRIFDEN